MEVVASRLLVAAISLAILGSCGTSDEVSSDGLRPAVSQMPSSSGVDATGQEQPLGVVVNDGDFECDPFTGLVAAHAVIDAEIAASGERMNTSGELSPEYEVSKVYRRESVLPVVRDEEVASLAVESFVASSLSDFIDDEVLLDLGTGGRRLLMIAFAPDVNNKLNAELVAAGKVAEDGAITLLGRCGESWSPSIIAGAAQMTVEPNFDFLLQIAVWGTPEAEAVQLARNPVPLTPWVDQDRSTRSLDLRDVPEQYLDQFDIVGLVISIDSSTSQGFISVRTSEGVSGTYATTGVSGVVPVLVPRIPSATEVYYLESPDADPVLIGAAGAGVLDTRLGAELIVTGGSGSMVAALRTLDAGELERVMGMSRDEIEELRESLLQP